MGETGKMSRNTIKEHEAANNPAHQKRYVKPELFELGGIVHSTFGSATRNGDRGGRGKRN